MPTYPNDLYQRALIAGAGLIHAAVVKTKATGEVCLADEKNYIERHETAVGASFGGRRSVMPMHSDPYAQ